MAPNSPDWAKILSSWMPTTSRVSGIPLTIRRITLSRNRWYSSSPSVWMGAVPAGASYTFQ